MPVADYKTARYVAIKRFTYDGHEVEPGEFLEPAFLINDRIIFRDDSRLVSAAPPAGDRREFKCDRCGRAFVSEHFQHAHQRRLYEVEHTAPEHVASLREEEGKRVGRQLKSTTLADLATRAGHDVRVNEAGVPMIQRQ